MAQTSQNQSLTWPWLAWCTVALAGVIAPALAMMLLAGSAALAPILAVGLMGAGIIGAAADGRLGAGILFAAFAGVFLMLLASVLGFLAGPHLFSTAFAILVASISFAARGALFARSALGKGWWIAVFVVAGEAAILATAAAQPGALPEWLLVLLPAQWARLAFEAALSGAGTVAAGSALIALGGTAAATLLVVRLWPRRWTYAVMFTVWLSLSALIWHWPPSQNTSQDTVTAVAARI